jgi:GNAT superfamily N-acetyltransferase
MALHQGRDPAAAAAPHLSRPHYAISHSSARFDYTQAVSWLLAAHWTAWQKPEQIYRALHNSILIGAYDIAAAGKPLVGFARVVSDRATNSMLTDLYVDEPHRRRRVGCMLMDAVTQHDYVRPTLCVLGSRPHLRAFYGGFGFVVVSAGPGGDIMVRNPTP